MIRCFPIFFFPLYYNIKMLYAIEYNARRKPSKHTKSTQETYRKYLMTPIELRQYLDRLVTSKTEISTMIWGPPGVGKSSIVAQIAKSHGIAFVDVRLSQLAPTDLRGLPVPENGRSKWFPPEFLPDGGKGILFLDELNMAPPAMQGIAQQLILDRKVGSYTVPPNWFIWAAGNRKEDRASVFEMPAPLANRFLHLTVLPDMDRIVSSRMPC
jgi:MoxR-like ATPase